MKNIINKKMVDQIFEWRHQGLINDTLLDALKLRYDAKGNFGSAILRWLGFFSLSLLGISVLTMIGIAIGKTGIYFAPLLVGGIGIVLWVKGVAFASDPEQRYPMSGSLLLTASIFACFGEILLLYYLMVGEAKVDNIIPIAMLITAGLSFFTAYKHGLRWPLIIAVLLIFHSLGNMHRYWGHGGYFFGIHNELLTLFVSLISISIGKWHEIVKEKSLNERHIGFGQAFIIIGLIYANTSLLFLSIPRGEILMVIIFTIACIAQIILGGRFIDGRFTGFGIVFLSINIYTRLFESFWDKMSKGSFFLLAGIIGLVIGAALELRARKLKWEHGP